MQIRELATQKLFEWRRVRRRRVRTLMLLALKHTLNGSLIAPPVGPGRARSPTDRKAPQLGGAMGAVFAFRANCGESAPRRPSQLRGYGLRGERSRPGPTGGAARGRLR